MAEAKFNTEKFWDSAQPIPFCGCFVWMRGTFSKNGYGAVHFRGVTRRAHRVAWILNNGEIPKGLKVLHSCDNPPCINPAHLFLGTDSDNMKDRDKKNRQCKGADHPDTKLTPHDAKMILDLRGQRWTLGAIGSLWEVSKQRIWQIERGIKCKHLVKKDMS